MRTTVPKTHVVLCSALLSSVIGAPAIADDIEIYQSQAGALGARPNVLFVIDTSGSMDTTVESPAVFDPSKTYSGSCSNSNVYFSLNDTVPACNSNNYFPATSNVCNASATALGASGGGMWPATGASREKIGQFRGNNKKWQSIATRGDSGFVECAADAGIHGQTAASNNRYIANNTSGFANTDGRLWDTADLNSQSYRLFNANYLNYYNGNQTVEQTRLQIVRDVAINLAGSLQNVNLGLMRYSSDAQGGYVLQAVNDIAQNRSAIISTLKAFTPTSGDGYTPLSETLYEAALYFKGDTVDYGSRSSPANSVSGSRDPANTNKYNSPIDYQCQKNYVVYLTDGLPTHDHDANDKAKTLIGKACDDPDAPSSSGWEKTDGRCTDDIAEYMSTKDLSATQTGTQSASTYMIGFGSDVKDSVSFLNDVAKAGGTDRAYTAADTATLTEALQTIFSNIQKRSSTFVTPSVTINAFNRAQTSDEVYFSLFQADQGIHWPGNLKKYRNVNGSLVDANGNVAADASGYFSANSKSIWSTETDGAEVTKGGAASVLPAPDARKLYTFLGQNPITNGSNALTATGSGLTDALVGSGTATTSCSAACQDTINWARGQDVTDIDADGNKTEQVRFIGDPLHAKLGVVNYGGTVSAPDEKDAVVYVPTNDGFLHAFSGKTGQELWAFIPPELLSRLFLLKENNASAVRSYGLDGDIRVLKIDNNRDGIVDPTKGDSVWLYFGMRAGGNHYYAIDVTDRNAPKLKWNIGPNELPGVGQTWSAPVVSRVSVTSGTYGNDDPQKLVLIFGGGYDSRQENQPYSVDTVGNRIFMVDARTGKLLWLAGAAGANGAPSNQLVLPDMNNSIPSGVTVLDTNGDTFADRMYVGDMGGRVWRFDIVNGQAPSTLVTGGVFARLGAGGAGANPAKSLNRRFYYAPDVALIQLGNGDPYYNIAIGSGYRGHPLNTDTEEHFYALRDRRPYAQMSKSDYQSASPILPDDPGLVDITANPGGIAVSPDAKGWKLRVSAQAGRSGEKVLAQSTTYNGVLLFTSFQPTAPSAVDPCFPTNVNRMYALYASSAKAALDLNGDGVVSNNDATMNLALTGGIAGSVVVGLDYLGSNGDGDSDGGNNGGNNGGGNNGGGNNGGGGGNPSPPPPPGGSKAYCRVNLQYVPCPPGRAAVRTYWQRKGAK